MADSDINRLKERLRSIPKAMQAAVQPALEKSGAELVAQMQTLCPVATNDAHGMPPGALGDSIVMTKAGEQTPAYSQPGGQQTVPENAVFVTCGDTKVRYGHFVEFGTRHMSAEPFFWPSYRMLKPRIAAATKRAMQLAAREGWGK